MTNKSIRLAFGAWARKRPGGLPGFVAAVCLTGAALLTLSKTLGRHAHSFRRSTSIADVVRAEEGEVERRSAEDRWRVEVSTKLEELLARVPGCPEDSASRSN